MAQKATFNQQTLNFLFVLKMVCAYSTGGKFPYTWVLSTVRGKAFPPKGGALREGVRFICQ